MEHLLENPREPISCWDLERKVCVSKEQLQSHAHGTDEMLDARAERPLAAALREKAGELAGMENDPTAPAFEIEVLRRDLARLREHFLSTHAGHGRKKLLNATDSDKARQRVRKALAGVIEAVRGQSWKLGEALEMALGKGNMIQFIPPPDWEM